MNDGRCAQAQAVLALLRAFADDYNVFVRIYSNCREQGYCLTLSKDKYESKEIKHYFVYEHRNSDELCVMVTDKGTNQTGLMEEYTKWNDCFTKENQTKYDVTKMFGAYEIYECAMWIYEDMRAALQDVNES